MYDTYLRVVAPRVRADDVTNQECARPVHVVGTDDWAVDQVVALLEAAGMPTITCHPTGEPAFPCNAFVAGRTCPLDVGFDVTVTVRARPVATPTPGEIGIVCALLNDAALVTAGMSGSPFVPVATRAVGDTGDLVAAIRSVLAERAPSSSDGADDDGETVDITRDRIGPA